MIEEIETFNCVKTYNLCNPGDAGNRAKYGMSLTWCQTLHGVILLAVYGSRYGYCMGNDDKIEVWPCETNKNLWCIWALLPFVEETIASTAAISIINSKQCSPSTAAISMIWKALW